MLKRRLPPALLILALIGGGIALWSGDTPEVVTTAVADHHPAPVQDHISYFAGQVKERAAQVAASEAVVVSAEVRSLSREASAQLAEECALRQLGQAKDIYLTPEQWSDLAALTLHCQAVRQAYEATIAKSVTIAPGRYRVEVPAYPDAGDALRGKLQAEIREKIGGYAAEELLRRLGPALEGRFGGFGIGIQTLDFAADVSGGDAGYSVTRTALYWNSTDAKDRMTTRRETYFPGLEDPSGHTWGPFLALIATPQLPKIGS